MGERKPGPCYRCGKNPAEGWAATWTAAEGERWYCHGDDDESPTCYEGGAGSFDPVALGFVEYLLRDGVGDLSDAGGRVEP